MKLPNTASTDVPKIEARWRLLVTKCGQSPFFWLIFGFLIFPVIALISSSFGIGALRYLGLLSKFGLPEFGWGGIPGLFLGGPLGLVSALSAWMWRYQEFAISRFLAFLGGSSIGGFWLAISLPVSPHLWIGEFGFVVLPLLWSLGLIVVAIFARPTSEQADISG